MGKRFKLGFVLVVSCLLAEALSASPLWGAGWRRLGPEGGDVRRLRVDPFAPQRVYALVTNQLFVSEDGGLFWSERRVRARPLHQLVLDPVTPGRLYALENQAVLRSDDAGETWLDLSAGLPIGEGVVQDLAINPTQPSRLWASLTGEAIFRSDDAGASWRRLDGSPLDVRRLALDPTNSSVAYAAPPIGLYRTLDGGATWQEVAVVSRGLPVLQDLVVVPGPTSTVYAVSFFEVHRSRDRGESWTASTSGLPAEAGLRALASPAGGGGPLWLAADSGLFTSADEGATWVRAPAPERFYTAIAMAGGGSQPRLHAGGVLDSGVLRSDDGGHGWVEHTAGLVGTWVSDLEPDPGEPGALYAGVVGGVHRSLHDGLLWQRTSGGLPPRYDVRDVVVLEGEPGRLLATLGAAIYRTEDRGASWQLAGEILPSAFLLSLVPQPGSPHLLWAATFERGILRSTDAGVSWAEVNVGLPEGARVRRLEGQAGSPWTLWAATSVGAYRATADGPWQAASNGIPTDDRDLTEVRAGGHPAQLLAVSRRGNVYRSTDGGMGWRAVSPAWLQVETVEPDARRPDVFYAAARALDDVTGVVLRVSAGGASWEVLGQGPELVGRVLRLEPGMGRRLYLGGLGVWVSPELEDVVFVDGFESGSLSSWDAVVVEP